MLFQGLSLIYSHGLTSVNYGGVSRRGVITPRSLFDQHERVGPTVAVEAKGANIEHQECYVCSKFSLNKRL